MRKKSLFFFLVAALFCSFYVLRFCILGMYQLGVRCTEFLRQDCDELYRAEPYIDPDTGFKHEGIGWLITGRKGHGKNKSYVFRKSYINLFSLLQFQFLKYLKLYQFFLVPHALSEHQ
jgi:hypothetical protein